MNEETDSATQRGPIVVVFNTSESAILILGIVGLLIGLLSVKPQALLLVGFGLGVIAVAIPGLIKMTRSSIANNNKEENNV